MAKRKSSDSKTAAILNYSKEHPQAGPSAIAEALRTQGMHVSAQYVSTIKSKFGVPGPRKRRGAGRGRVKGAAAQKASPAAQASGKQARGKFDVGYDSLVKAKQFVQSMGGLEQARRVLDAYANLASSAADR